MGFETGKNKTIDKRITDDQDYKAEFKGDKKRWVETEYRFYGQDWENFAALLARHGFEQSAMNFFVGAHLLYHVQKVVICGSFAHGFWTREHAAKFQGWTFDLNPKAVKLPAASKDEDLLHFKINGRDASEIWEEHFVARQEKDEAS